MDFIHHPAPPPMRLRFSTKLLLLLLLTGTLLVAAMTLATRWSFQSGFLEYLAQVELSSLDPLADALLEEYAKRGDWSFVAHNAPSWHRFLRLQAEAANPLPPQPEPPPAPPFGRGPGGRGPPPPGPRDIAGQGGRLRLLDADRNHLVGPPDESGHPVLRPLRHQEEIVGWLSLTPLPFPEGELARGFNDRQVTALWPIAVGAFALALLLAVPLGRHLLQPVRRVAEGARRLAAGHYATRLPELHTRDELGRLTSDFNHLADSLERNEALRRRGMADVSHELRTPLALLRAEIEAIQDGIRPCDGERLAALHDTVMGLSRLVDDLYDLALSDAGALNYRMEALDLAELAQMAAESARAGFVRAGLELECEITSPLPLEGDPRRLRQVLDNLLSNSRRYTDTGGRTRLRAAREGGRLVVEVEDSAPGVAAELRGRLFERFYRVEASRNRARGGAGLGLAICANIVAAHGGTLAAGESPLGGLKVRVELPGA